MGNAMGLGNNSTTIEDKIKIIATQFILTQDYESMRNMATNTSYCNQIQQLANTLIKQNMKPDEITRFAEQIRQPSQPPQQQRSAAEAQKQDCLALANYFTLLAHLFSAIMTTVNPMFYYTNEQGKTQRSTLYNKQNLPNNAKYVVEGSFCTRRIDGLTNDNFTKSTTNYDERVSATDNIILTPQLLCNQLEEEQKDPRNFNAEIGLADLDKLYFSEQDNYNNNNYNSNFYNNRNNNNSTPEQRADVLQLYTAITGETVLPNNIQKFADLDFSRSSNLDVWRKDICVNKVDKSTMFSVDNDDDAMKSQDTDTQNLFVSYGKHIKEMLMFNSKQKEILLKIIDQLFEITKSSTNNNSNSSSGNNTVVPPPPPPKKETFKETVTIKTNVTLSKLKELIALARKTILNLYITCERSFLAGLGIYESIIEQKILNKQLNDDEFDMIIADIMLKSHQGSSTPTSSTTSLTSATAAAAAAAAAKQPQFLDNSVDNDFANEDDEFGEPVGPTPKIVMKPPTRPLQSILKSSTPTIPAAPPIAPAPAPATAILPAPAPATAILPAPAPSTAILPATAPATPVLPAPTTPILSAPATITPAPSTAITPTIKPTPIIPVPITPILPATATATATPAPATPITPAPATPITPVVTIPLPPAAAPDITNPFIYKNMLGPKPTKECSTIIRKKDDSLGVSKSNCENKSSQIQVGVKGPCKFNETTNTCEKGNVTFDIGPDTIIPNKQLI